MFPSCPHSIPLRISALVAAIFGILTLIAGGRILLGLGEAGYSVVQPVLLFNTIMGALYLLTAVFIARSSQWARSLAIFIAAANVVVLLAIVVMRATGGTVANETMGAMTLRSVVWLTIAAVLVREYRRRPGVLGQA